ncbi:MAG: hypothetical protein COW02_12815 [Comamonadaceae bacterium CG12_big_fil_rev_8_21_14_0_65_59_15]|nr:MAG: hypothetical protein COW02_12815 [Comamonadaceae bacterium CG12_big_fil_rev_8_21_14_0_65_59_15]
MQAQTEAPSVPAEPLLPAGRHEKSGSFVHSLAFVIDEPPPEPQTFKKGIPVVQRLTIHWP